MHAEQKGFPGIGRLVIYVLLVLVALYYLIPLYVMLTTSVKSLAEIRSGNLLDLPMSPSGAAWAKAWSGACTGVRCEGLQPFFWNSVRMVVPAVLLSTLIGSLNGYVLAHWRFRYSEIVFTALMVGCFIPFQVVILPMARLLGLFGLSNTTMGLVMVHIIYGVAFTTLFFRNYYVSVPEELVKAARIDGAGFFMIYRRIIFPLSLPIFMVCFIWQFTQIWNDFLFGVVFGGSDAQPVTVALNNLVNTSTGIQEHNVNMAAAIIAALPTLVIYLIAGKYFVRGLTAGAVKG
ncbi:carbohydrate ABC transporter permease [Actimicrobium sp. CCI2.3]|uniref:carbohydrate ABC transporter permease n=1 Tax=Actimicrobium sp. CCI2.3 TaxID=3048616 RepID=UPI002AB3A32B|nr:carbohydrate ABC transporter permease [Actimicrobium sp. CCI2.3]MDY7573188.1 carbohydrate ABC transporter permease [Actimicrobium sp. CCI2.3]MEB0022167.1 carbohydrate ABC transporter permease [Actimicrobium sp. CCI2.3]